MTDLDRQIAEIKGWRRLTRPELKKVYGAMGIIAVPESGDLLEVYQTEGAPLGNPPWKACPLPAWSTSDSKALELVDEFPEIGFTLDHFGTAIMKGGYWSAQFRIPRGHSPDWNIRAEAATRPEAICRAYIAAVTWMRGRG